VHGGLAAAREQDFFVGLGECPLVAKGALEHVTTENRVPPDDLDAPGKRHGFTWRTTVQPMGGSTAKRIGAAQRAHS
jgi:hypothetical protein